MSAFDLSTGEADARLRDLLRQPEPGPDAFAGFWGAAKNAAEVAPLESLRAASPVLDAFGKTMAFAHGGEGSMLNGQKVTDLAMLKRETVDRIGQNDLRAELTPEINRLTPDPRVTGTAAQLVFGFGKTAGKAIGYSVIGGNVGGAIAFGLDEGMNEGIRLQDKGVDTGTAVQAGTVHGLTMAASAALPIAGKTKLQTAGLVVAGGPAAYIAEQATIREILRSANYERIAEDYKPFDPVGLIVSTAAPAAFGTVAHGMRALKGEPRGVRNHNPGNLVKSDIPWDGKITGADARFESFTTAEQGIAALARNLLTYQQRHGLDSVDTIINRWAPPSENKTGQYVATVAKALDVAPGDKLDLSEPGTLARLTKAIIKQENGKQPYSDAQIEGSVRAAIEGRAIRPTAEQADAAHVAYLAAHADSGNLGRTDDIVSRNAHIEALEAAARMIDEGGSVRVSDLIQPLPENLQALDAEVTRGLGESYADEIVAHNAPPPVAGIDALFQVHPDRQGALRQAVETAATPEQKAFFQSLLDQPGKELPTGELDPEGRPVVRSAAELMTEAKGNRLQADEQARGIDAAIHCFLRG